MNPECQLDFRHCRVARGVPLMAGLSGFAGVFGGNPAGSYQDSRKKQQGLDQGDVDAQAQAAAGNAYMGMFGQQQTPGAPPGQAQPGMPPQQHGIGGLLQGLLQKLQGAGGGPQPPSMQPSPQQPMMPPPGPGGPQPMSPGGGQPGMPQAAVPGARPMMPPQGGPPQGGLVGSPQGPGMGQQQPPATAPMPGQPQGGMQPQGGQSPQGQLTWQTVVQKVVQSNPGVKDPRVIAAAVDKFLPLMNQQTQQQWKEMSLMLRQQQVDLGASSGCASRAILGSSGSTRAPSEEEGIEKRSDRREDRLERAQILRDDAQHNMLAMQEKRLQSQITANKDRTMLGQWRAIVNAQHARAQEIIGSAAAGMDPKERQRLLAEEDKAYTDKIKEMRTMMDGGADKGSMVGKPGEEITGGGTVTPGKPVATQSIKPPVKVNSPEDLKGKPSGFRYITHLTVKPEPCREDAGRRVGALGVRR